MPLRARTAVLVAGCALASLAVRGWADGAARIDRRALVARHNVVHRAAAPEHFLQVGNGEFAFAFDVTGLQTLDRAFDRTIPLHTMSNWGWHSFPNADDFRYEQTLSPYAVGDREVPYADRQDAPAGQYFRANPHRVNLARIGLWWEGQDAAGTVNLADFTSVDQTLDLWSGAATSRFKFRGQEVAVVTVADPEHDAVAFRIESPLVATAKLGVMVRFSSPSGEWGPRADDWKSPEKHITNFETRDSGRAMFARRLDDWQYLVAAHAGPAGRYDEAGPHGWRVTWPGGEAAEFVVEFSDGATPSRRPPQRRPDFADVRAAAADHWKTFWSAGGAIDFSAVDDPRAAELERRLVLSQYLTAIQNGSLPPQESGLVCNSWFGKAHLEMHWWHAAHFALWGRTDALERSLAWYEKILPQAQAIARRQGYAGARWPKMTGPDGVSSPSGVGEFLIWQQPHIIALAELVRRARPTAETIARYQPLVDETAEFMADYVAWEADGEACHLGPPLIPAQENYRPRVTRDPTFELAYWHWALSTAQAWRERTGRPREPRWDRVLAALPRPFVRDGRYAAVAVEPFTNPADHPSMLCAFGVLPQTPLIDPATMLATARWVDDDAPWDWKSTWGWDFPVIAMTYARAGDPDRAVAALLRDTPKNSYLTNGHNHQEQRLPVYLPGNGGTLYAAALMAAGWDAAPRRSAPGFPPAWQVRHEGLLPAP